MTTAPGAQTERRGGAGPVGGLLGRKDPPAAFRLCRDGRGRYSSASKLAEAAVELAVVQTVHVAVTVEVEVPQEGGVGGVRPEREPEKVAVHPIHIAIAVAVAEKPVEDVNTVAAG